MNRRRCLMWAASGLVVPVAGDLAAESSRQVDAPSDRRHDAIAKVLSHTETQAPLTHAVVVEHRRQIVGETYFTAQDKPSGDWLARTVAFDAGTLHDMRSISKSVVALLVGIAHGKGLIDLERPVMDWFPRHAALATPQRRAIRLEHLLTMTAGFEWDESSVSYGSFANSETRMGLSIDPVAHVLSRDMVAAPGSRFAYCGGATLLLAHSVERATGRAVDMARASSRTNPT